MKNVLLVVVAVISLMACSDNYTYEDGVEAFKGERYGEALEFWVPLAKDGHPDAAFGSAWIYLTKEGYKDDKSALLYFKIAADNGLLKAKYNLARFLSTGELGRFDKDLAYKYAMECAQQGVVGAQHMLGLMLCDRNECKKGVEWFKKAAAESNYPASQYKLGLLYLEGVGVKKDITEGVRWITYAAENGYVIAQHYLGLTYATGGDGVERDRRKALMWLGKVSEVGNDDATFVMAHLLLEGDVGQRREGLRLLKQLSARGYAKAEKTLNELRIDGDV